MSAIDRNSTLNRIILPVLAWVVGLVFFFPIFWLVFTKEEEALRQALIRNFEASQKAGWNEANLSANVPDAAREVELPLREAYRLTYELLLGVDVAPKLAPLLAAMEPNRVLRLMRGA